MQRQLDIAAPEATAISVDLAGTGARSLAFIFDFKIRFSLALIWVVVAQFITNFSIIAELASDSVSDYGSNRYLLTAIPAMIIYLGYHPILEIVMRGRTPGKRFAGIRVATASGRVPGVGAILIRNIFRFIDSAPAFYLVGIATTLLTKQSVRIGDLAAGTVLVYDDRVKIKQLDKITAVANSLNLSPADQSLLLDVVDRWRTLSRDKQILFASELVTRAGGTLEDVEGRKPKLQVQILRQKLLRMLKPRVREKKPMPAEQRTAA